MAPWQRTRNVTQPWKLTICVTPRSSNRGMPSAFETSSIQGMKQNRISWIGRKPSRNKSTQQVGKSFSHPTTSQQSRSNQLEHVEDIQFPPKMEMHRTIPPGPRSTHNLSLCHSINPEPMLESWHGRFAHMGNTGMRPGLADCLHLRGACEGNVVVRHKLSVMNEDSVLATLADPPEPPRHLRDRPVLKDH
jgi:hypothetical protein